MLSNVSGSVYNDFRRIITDALSTFYYRKNKQDTISKQFRRFIYGSQTDPADNRI